MRLMMASLSKLAFVIVVKRFVVTRWFVSFVTSLPSARSAEATWEMPYVT